MYFRKLGLGFSLLMIALMGCNSSQSIPPTQTFPLTKDQPTPPSATQAIPTVAPVGSTPTLLVAPTVSPVLLSPIRRTPITVMLHESTPTFDSVKFLKQFIAILKAGNFKVVTYQSISKDPDITAQEQGHLAIITMDDLTFSKLNPSYQEMISALLDANYPAVLGVVTQGESDPEVVAYFKSLSDKGWEIASHTDTHPNLGDLEKTSKEGVYLEVKTSLDKIESAVGIRPITLVLPYGQMVNDPGPIQQAGITWIVGIVDGETYNVNKPPYYVGREGFDGTADRAFTIMMRRFNP